MTTAFIPSGQEGLLLRSPIAQNYVPPSYHTKPTLYSRNIRPFLSQKEDANILEEGSIPQKIGFYTRHNPHPGRVRHMKGLLDVPICIVEDNYERRLLYSAPTGQDYSIHYKPNGNTRYGANRDKYIPAIGIVPITYAWKDELERKTQKALNKALGARGDSSSAFSSRQSQRPDRQYDHLEDEQILDLLCRILQTNSIPACQAWLQCCSESEKNIVLNMLRMAATGEIDPYPTTGYNTVPTETNNSSDTTAPLQTDSTSKQYDLSNESPPNTTEFNSPFKLPEHDTIIKSAHTRLLSRQSERSFHERLQTELEQHVNSAIQQSRLQTPSTKRRSQSFLPPLEDRPVSNRSSRPRSRSSSGGNKRHSNMPPPPVQVNIMQEKLQSKNRHYHY